MDKTAEPLKCDEALAGVFILLGKRWTGVIIGTLLERPARFAEIAAAIPGITEAMLSTRLTELQTAGLVARTVHPGPPIASVYELTMSGAGLRPALMELVAWAHEHGLPGAEPIDDQAADGPTERADSPRLARFS